MIALQIAAYADVDGGSPSTGGLSHSCLEIADVQILFFLSHDFLLARLVSLHQCALTL